MTVENKSRRYLKARGAVEFEFNLRGAQGWWRMKFQKGYVFWTPARWAQANKNKAQRGSAGTHAFVGGRSSMLHRDVVCMKPKAMGSLVRQMKRLIDGPESTSLLTKGSHPSPDGSLVASIQASRLVLQDADTFEIKRTIQLSAELASNVCFLKWSPYVATSPIDTGEHGSGLPLAPRMRLLAADEQTVEIYDAHAEEWKAVLAPGFGGVKHVDFGGDDDEILVLSEFGLKVTIWSLRDSSHVDIQYPKFGSKGANPRCPSHINFAGIRKLTQHKPGFGYRPETNHFALLTRPVAHDVLDIYSRQSYAPIKSVELPTIDAQGLKWSPDGRWIAIWDSPGSAYRVLLYTANGHMFRTHEQPCVIEMRHTLEVKQPATDVWSEELSVHGDRHYTLVIPPVNLPTVESPASDPNPKIGVSTISFSADRTLVVTKDERMPTSVWIWSLESLSPLAILVQLSQVKAIQWHPTRGDLLAVVCGADPNNVSTSNIPSVYLWSRQWDYPRAVKVSQDLLAANLWLKWIDQRVSVQPDTTGGEIGTTEESEDSSDTLPSSVNFIAGDKGRFQILRLDDRVVTDA
ncbi:hypothetical protein Dda_9154 [Drechslerella dactyloides]|uniref:WD40 domain-containing protein n=1 Tax=Drechslerella dactyloides TaxID=74499 RepID=A0AAD6ITC9_DREDA|nr:hypothetical protein Dda_9154 [Drechslerella dactyloides]